MTQQELDLETRILYAKHFVDSLIKPKILENISTTLNIKTGRIDLKPTFQGLDWELIVEKRFTLCVTGDYSVPHSDKIVGGDVTFQIIFLPEKFAPESGRIKISWADSVVSFDKDYVKTVLEKFICPTCSKIRGANCECVPNVQEIDLGAATRSLEAIKKDALSALTSMQISKKEAQEIVDYVTKNFPGLFTFDAFIKECFKAYQTKA